MWMTTRQLVLHFLQNTTSSVSERNYSSLILIFFLAILDQYLNDID